MIQLLAQVSITTDDDKILTTTLYDSLSASISKFEKLQKGQRFMTQNGEAFEVQEISAQLLTKSLINEEGAIQGMEAAEGSNHPYNLIVNIRVNRVS